MEESDLLKERIQAITEKHRIQEDIRQKKLELDQEKLRLQHLKKKSLKEQWLLQDSSSHNATDSPRQQSLRSDQQRARALQLSVRRIEMEVVALEQEESMISSNESFILNRLKEVEKSPEEIIKEAHENFVAEPVQVVREVAPESPSPPASHHTEPNTPRKTVFAMEISVSKDLLTGESTVLSTAPVPPEDAHPHDRVKVYEDSRKCVYALNSQQESHDQTCVSELSANEVEDLLRGATAHRQVNYQTYHHKPSRREAHCFYSYPDDGDRGQGGRHGNYIHSNSADFSWQRRPQPEHHYDHHYSWQEDRHSQSNVWDAPHFGSNRRLGFHHGDRPVSSYQVRDCYDVEEHRPVVHHSSSFRRSDSRVSGARANGCVPPRSHDQEVEPAYHPELCYTPANYIPLTDYITVGDGELYCCTPPSYQPTAVYGGPSPSDRVPSPLYGDDSPYTILSPLEATEPITAIFMGFQTALDDRSQFEGSLKAELVILDDCEDNEEERRGPKGSGVNGGLDCVEGRGDRRTDKQV